MGISDLQILIPYQELQKLLKAVEEVPRLQNELKRTNDQLTALRGLYSELLDCVRDLADQV